MRANHLRCNRQDQTLLCIAQNLLYEDNYIFKSINHLLYPPDTSFNRANLLKIEQMLAEAEADFVHEKLENFDNAVNEQLKNFN